jgi:predicted transglutaminase-like cysteine proteinase
MLRFRSAGGTTRMVACVVALGLVLGALPARAEGVTRSERGSAKANTVPAPVARFFRITDVLSKIDAGKKPGAEDRVRLAAHGADVLSDAPPLRGSLPVIGDEPFGLFAFRAPEGTLWRKWRRLKDEIADEQDSIARCRDNADACTGAAKRFLSILDATKAREGRAQLDAANRGINAAIRYVSDLALEGEPDRWRAPLATLSAGRGDCEDYAIAKYVILRDAGFPLADLRFLLVHDRLARLDHAVLAARLEGRWLILDNRFAAIPEDTRLYNFTPLYALDHEGVKLVAAPYAKRAPVGEDMVKPAAWLDGGPYSLRGAVDVAQADEARGEMASAIETMPTDI